MNAQVRLTREQVKELYRRANGLPDDEPVRLVVGRAKRPSPPTPPPPKAKVREYDSWGTRVLTNNPAPADWSARCDHPHEVRYAQELGLDRYQTYSRIGRGQERTGAVLTLAQTREWIASAPLRRSVAPAPNPTGCLVREIRSGVFDSHYITNVSEEHPWNSHHGGRYEARYAARWGRSGYSTYTNRTFESLEDEGLTEAEARAWVAAAPLLAATAREWVASAPRLSSTQTEST